MSVLLMCPHLAPMICCPIVSTPLLQMHNLGQSYAIILKKQWIFAFIFFYTAKKLLLFSSLAKNVEILGTECGNFHIITTIIIILPYKRRYPQWQHGKSSSWIYRHHSCNTLPARWLEVCSINYHRKFYIYGSYLC